jgi:hypothetical protein
LENQRPEAVGSSRDSATSRANTSISNGGDLGAGIFHAERKTVWRARSMSGDAKPLFSGTYKPGSEPPMRTTSSGQIEPLVAARSPSAQEGRSLHLQC